jgi:hypothetical protein
MPLFDPITGEIVHTMKEAKEFRTWLAAVDALAITELGHYTSENKGVVRRIKKQETWKHVTPEAFVAGVKGAHERLEKQSKGVT